MEITDARSATFRGRDCFTLLYSDLQREYTNIQHTAQSVDHKALCIAAYNAFANYRQVVVGHYFRTFYNIVKFIDKSSIEDTQTYINILRAQLSSSELNLLFYNCLSDYGSHKFKPYIEQFGLLENMMLSNLIRQDHKGLYKESAFKSPL
jgi:S-adenosylmethionine hydrolase